MTDETMSEKINTFRTTPSIIIALERYAEELESEGWQRLNQPAILNKILGEWMIKRAQNAKRS